MLANSRIKDSKLFKEFTLLNLSVYLTVPLGELCLGTQKLYQSSRAHPLIGEPKYEATAYVFIVNLFKPPLLMSLFSIHPPVEGRVKRLEKI